MPTGAQKCDVCSFSQAFFNNFPIIVVRDVMRTSLAAAWGFPSLRSKYSERSWSDVIAGYSCLLRVIFQRASSLVNSTVGIFIRGRYPGSIENGRSCIVSTYS